MSEGQPRAMRDTFLERIYAAMREDDRVFFVSADLGAPVLDRIRVEFSDRFVNVGIAEQNCINVATGLALEGYKVYVYGIAAFIVMRSYEQIRTNLSVASQVQPLDVNIVGVGAGLSYQLSGPSHHCLEDIALLRLLPNIDLFSPSDWELAARCAAYSVESSGPKYFRLDSKPVHRIYQSDDAIRIEKGFHELRRGERACVISTGYMTHVALKVAARTTEAIGVVDVFNLKPPNNHLLCEALKGHRLVVALEEGFVNRDGLGAMILEVLTSSGSRAEVRRLGVDNRYMFDLGGREYLHAICGMGEEGLLDALDAELAR